MQIFIDLAVLCVCWIVSIMAAGKIVNALQEYKEEKVFAKLVPALLCVLGLAVCLVLASLVSTRTMLFGLGGIVAGIILVVDPFGRTEERAQEIGKHAAREKAIKDQQEEQKRRDDMELKENARIYREEKAKLKKKD